MGEGEGGALVSCMDDVKKIADESPAFRDILFARGYLFTNADTNAEEYPFYGAWSKEMVAGFCLLTHPKTRHFTLQTVNETFVLIGHVYNPFDGLWKETDILRKYAETDDRIGYFNQWTGLFTLITIKKNVIEVLGDCAGMQATYYGVIADELFISSHAQLIGDICGLKQSQFVQRLTCYRFWKMYGIFLPGDISQFDGVFRLVPNHILMVSLPECECSVLRFYPFKNIKTAETEQEYEDIICEIGRILHENMELISQKWHSPAISMTGGMDSKTTLACANGLYDRFKYFSYVSMYGDKPDAEAAKTIADVIGVKHTTYIISENDDDFLGIDLMRTIMEHNLGDIGKVNANDVRKRLFFLNKQEFDVEVKSWVSEVGRANYYKKFGVKKMPYRLSPRQMTSMYKFFTYNRRTALETDQVFRKYIEKMHSNEILNLDSSDMYLWEVRYGGWGGLTITSEHRVSYDITIPFNNRLLMELFLRLPLEKRIKDIPHYDVIRMMNEKIDRLGITVTNYNETKKRMYCEKAYYFVHSALPF